MPVRNTLSAKHVQRNVLFNIQNARQSYKQYSLATTVGERFSREISKFPEEALGIVQLLPKASLWGGRKAQPVD